MDLDLNIDNYRIPEIEDFFHLESPYSLKDVLKNETQIMNVIINDHKFNVERKTEFIEFMKKAKQRLIAKLRKQLEKEIQNENELEEESLLIPADIGKVVNQTTAVQMGGNSFVQQQETTTFNEMANPNK